MKVIKKLLKCIVVVFIYFIVLSGSVRAERVTTNQPQTDQSLWCAERGVRFGTANMQEVPGSAYTYDSWYSRDEAIISYIISQRYIYNYTSSALVDQPIQQAIWRWQGSMSEWEMSSTARTLYNAADSYATKSIAAYKSTPSRQSTSITTTSLDANYWLVGPFRVSFNNYSDCYDGVDGTLRNENGTNIGRSNWNFCNSYGTVIAPSSDTNFYIKISKSVNINSASLTLDFSYKFLQTNLSKLYSPTQVNIGGDGNVYFCSTHTSQFNQCTDPDGSCKKGRGSSYCSNCQAVWADINGNPHTFYHATEGKTGDDAYVTCGKAEPAVYIDVQKLFKVNSFNNTYKTKSLTITFDVVTIDLGINKFVTKINNKSITGRNYNKNTTLNVTKGDLVTFTLRVTNYEKYPTTAAVIVDTLPVGMEFVSGDSGVSASGRNLTITSLATTQISQNSYRDVSFVCRVTKETERTASKLTNRATITRFNWWIGNTRQTPMTTDKDTSDNSSADSVTVLGANLDLALRKHIVEIDGTSISGRAPSVYSNPIGRVSKNPLYVIKGYKIKYEIRVYNEGSTNAWATEITDSFPSYLVFDPSDATNRAYGWTQSGTGTVKTTYLSNQQMTRYSGGSVDSKYVYLVLTVGSGSIPLETAIENRAQISGYKYREPNLTDYTNQDRVVTVDVDSYAGNGFNNGEDDQDGDSVKLPNSKVDLALKKFITSIDGDANIGSRVPTVSVAPLNSGGTNAQYTHSKEPLWVEHGSKVNYTIRIYNEGDTDAYATEIKDVLPSWLEYVSSSSSNVSASGQTITIKTLENTSISKFNGSRLDYRDVTLVCKVKDNAPLDTNIINNAEITGYAYIEEKLTYKTNKKISIIYDVDSKAGGRTYASAEDDEDYEVVIVPGPERGRYVDLSLRKFITSIDGDRNIGSRVPTVDVGPLKGSGTTATYTHTKNELWVEHGSLIGYTIRVYNEGSIDAYAQQIIDHLPNWLEFVSGSGCTASGKNIIITTLQNNKMAKFKTVTQNKVNYQVSTSYRTDLDYRDVTLVCRVTSNAPEDTKIINNAEISNYAKYEPILNTIVNIDSDRDSTENNIGTTPYEGNRQDDDDYELVVVPGPERGRYVDLSLRKFITSIDGDRNIGSRVPTVNVGPLKGSGTTATYTHTKNELWVEHGSLIGYTIRVYNEGSIDAYAQQIIDHLPNWLEFVSGSGCTASGKNVIISTLQGNKTAKFKTVTQNKVNYQVSTSYRTDLDYRDVTLVCRVTSNAPEDTKIINNAEISNYAKYEPILNTIVNIDSDRDSTENNIGTTPYEGNRQDDDDYELVVVPGIQRGVYVDLSLRKFITSIDGDRNIGSRVPTVNVGPLKGNATTATYTHTKNELWVERGSLIEYTIRVYNEGSRDAYAQQIIDHLPNWLEFVSGSGCRASGKNIIITTLQNNKMAKFKTVTQNKVNYQVSTSYRANLDYRDVTLVCRVTSNAPDDTKIINNAEISDYAKYEPIMKTIVNINSDIDSTENNIGTTPYEGNRQDDDDYELVVVPGVERGVYVDLSLRKFITAIDGRPTGFNGERRQIDLLAERGPKVDEKSLKENAPNTATYNHSKEVIAVKKKTKIEYTIRIYNEGTLDAYAREITDYLPEGIMYVNDPNSTSIKITSIQNDKIERFAKVEQNKMTYQVTKTYRQPVNGEPLDYSEVKILCEVKKTAPVLVNLVNIAEISEYGRHEDILNTNVRISKDIDSSPNNVNIPNDTERPNYTGAQNIGNYAKGQEDDDDYEVVNLMVTDIEGKVWVDADEGKQQTGNKILTNDDAGLGGVTVYLYEKDYDGNYNLVKDDDDNDLILTTDANGKYLFENQFIISDYKMEFKYSGQEYISLEKTGGTAVVDGKTVKTGYVELGADYTKYNSAAIEDLSDDHDGGRHSGERNALNNKFYEIVNGTSKNRAGTNTVALSYSKDENKHTATLNRGAEPFATEAKIKSYSVMFPGTADFVKYINLGLKKRAQTNLGLMTDVTKVTLTINGKEYEYDKTHPTAKGEIFEQKDENGAIDLNIKSSQLDSVQYSQAIYKSDYNFRIEDYKNDIYASNNAQRIKDYTGQKVDGISQSDELEIYVTYKTKIKNYASKDTKVSELKIYYDNTYTPVNSWYSRTVQGNDGPVTWKGETQVDNFNAMTTKTIVNENLTPNQDIYVFVTFRVLKTNDAERKIRIEGGKKYVVSEITGYTTEEGLIDINSEPGDINLTYLWDSYKNTYEDDTDRAPGLNIYVDESLIRTMSGFVFEDSIAGTDSDGVNIGDGIRQNTEQLQSGVIVQLIEKKKIGDETYEYIWQETVTGSNKIKYMDKSSAKYKEKPITNGEGQYKFTEYIPGDYIVRFIYGDEQTIDKNTVILSGQDYKSTTYHGDYAENTSNAKDNKQRRLSVMYYSIDLTDAKMEILANTGANANELAKNTWMNADTQGIMPVGINDAGVGHSVNFGVIERPKSKLVLHKELASVKVTNKGVRYIDTENGIGANISDVNKLSVELDDELINGATLDIKYNIYVENAGDVDTLYNYFEGDEQYGTIAEQKKHITTKATAVYDYSEMLGFTNAEASIWNIVDSSNRDDKLRILNPNVANKITAKMNKGMTVLEAKNESNLYKELTPDEGNNKTEAASITLSKILSIGGNVGMLDDFDYCNKAEIVRAENKVGRRDSESIYGNFEPKDNPEDETPEPDTARAETLIINPTGKPRPYYELWITAVALMIVGIVLIKKIAAAKR